MDWTAQIDAYRARLGPGFRAEPVNALSNLALLAAAAVGPAALGLLLYAAVSHPPRQQVRPAA